MAGLGCEERKHLLLTSQELGRQVRSFYKRRERRLNDLLQILLPFRTEPKCKPRSKANDYAFYRACFLVAGFVWPAS